MNIAFMDLKTQFQRMEPAIRKRIDAVLAHGRYIMGPEIEELEANLAELAGVKHVISCSSGTDALLMPLMAYGIQPGDAVFTTPFTFIATAEVIALLGARPVFVDIDPRTFNMDPVKLEAAVIRVKKEGKWRARGVIPVDLFGLAADYDAISKVAEEHDLFVLEDAAQSLGGVYHGRPVGSLGHVAATSFYPAKPLGAYGDAGAIFTDDDELANTLVSIRQHGQGQDKYHNVRVGLNGRMDSIQAAVLLVKLERFGEELAARQKVADWYGQKLKYCTTPFVPTGLQSSWALYSVLLEEREAVVKALNNVRIPSVIYYEVPLHCQEVFVDLGQGRGSFPVSEKVAGQILSLPMHPFLTETEVDAVAAVVNLFQ